MNNTVKVDESTIEKSLHSMIINLTRSYMVSNKISKEESDIKVSKFLKKIVTLELCNNNEINSMILLLIRSIDIIVKEYQTKKDKSFTGLLRIQEILNELHTNKS